MTIVEKDKIDVEKKVVTITDKYRTVEKILHCENLEDFLVQGKNYILSKIFVCLLSVELDRILQSLKPTVSSPIYVLTVSEKLLGN